ncbi:hypothetical protein HMPREF3189_01473 [Clostridiales bacterium KA00134]|nr:hypothetical protein HMPREF3189_01473 [Clostridiales bacterium KA00134]
MNRYVGTVVRGLRAPIVKKGDDLVEIVVDSVKKALESENIKMRDKDVVCVTESLVARAQGNYADIKDIEKDVSQKFANSDSIGLVFPILSRNRFSMILKGIAQTGKKIHLLLSYPSDEVGNHLMDPEIIYEKKINPYADLLEEKDYRRIFGEEVKHRFTGVDYVSLYKEIAGDNVEVHFSNDPCKILNYTKNVIVCSTHTRFEIKRKLIDRGAEKVLTLDGILDHSVDGSGYNPEYGVLGSNISSNHSVKLFPRDGQTFVNAIQEKLNAYSGKNIEVMIYGDGAFKDPIGKIWELADPVVSPAYTKGLEGTPNEIKIKYIADTELENLSGEEAIEAMREKIEEKDAELIGKEASLGTTPRALTDLLGSLSDLTSGSGDKGTPIVYIQGYFDNYASN